MSSFGEKNHLICSFDALSQYFKNPNPLTGKCTFKYITYPWSDYSDYSIEILLLVPEGFVQSDNIFGVSLKYKNGIFLNTLTVDEKNRILELEYKDIGNNCGVNKMRESFLSISIDEIVTKILEYYVSIKEFSTYVEYDHFLKNVSLKGFYYRLHKSFEHLFEYLKRFVEKGEMQIKLLDDDEVTCSVTTESDYLSIEDDDYLSNDYHDNRVITVILCNNVSFKSFLIKNYEGIIKYYPFSYKEISENTYILKRGKFSS
jgi:hypothetical protein